MFRVYRSLSDIGPEAGNCAVSIGNFDGVHAGHRKLLQRNLELSSAHAWIPSVLTFDPHPTKVVAPHRAPRLLTSMDERIELIRQAGIRQIFVLPFDEEFSHLSPEEFVRSILVEKLGTRAVLVGDNFRFGYKHSGSVETLRELEDVYGYRTEIVPGVSVRGKLASSSSARELIEAGNVSGACRILTRPHAIAGEIVPGFGIGAKSTVPTLNLRTDAEVLPARGVYITRTADLDAARKWRSITNVGYRPTFGGESLTIETYLLEPLTGEAPGAIRLEFLRRVREEKKFASPADLREQILRDVARANSYFRRVEIGVNAAL